MVPVWYTLCKNFRLLEQLQTKLHCIKVGKLDVSARKPQIRSHIVAIAGKFGWFGGFSANHVTLVYEVVAGFRL